MPTLPELLVQQAELSAQLAEFERPLVQEAHDILTGTAATDLAAALSTIRDQLPDSLAKTHIGNVLTVLNAVPQVLTGEMARLNVASPAFALNMPPVPNGFTEEAP
jgi:chemotaxis protein CheY-P-specific phosphatase CheC